MKIIKINSYTIPFCGNKHIFPYGALTIEDDSKERKIVRFGEFNCPWNSFSYKRKRYYFDNIGGLYNPIFIIKINN